MADFDTAAAKAAGYSDADIAKVQKGIVAARAAGYSDAEIRAHLSGGGASEAPAAAAAAPAAVSPVPVAPTPAAPDPGWSASRVLRDVGHYPALIAQAAANGVTGLANMPIALGGMVNTLLPGPYDADAAKLPNASGSMLFPQVNLGANAQPANAAEAYGSAAVAGTTAALLGGGLSRVPAVLQASGKEIASELPQLLRGAVGGGAIPAVATAAANRNLDLASLGPKGQTIAELLIGATAAVAGHQLLKGSPIETVAGKLGTSENSNDAGKIAQEATREWRKELPAKVEALKDIRDVPTTPEGDVTEPAMFGKVPLRSATADMTETTATLNALSKKGGIFAPLLHEFGNDMPVRAKALLDTIAEKNDPIKEYPTKAEKPYSGPLREDTSPIVESDRGDLVGKPVAGLAKPSAGLLAGPTEVPLPQPPVAAQTNPLQWQMKSPGVAGIAPEVEPSAVQLPSVVQRSSAPTEMVDPEMRGSKQLGPVRPVASEPLGPTNAVAKVSDEAPAGSPGFVTPAGVTVGFRAPLRDAMELRSYIGEMTAKGMMPKGTTDAQWDALYRGLSADLGNTMDRYGARGEWDHYNAATTRLYSDGNKLAKFSNDDNPAKDNAKPGEAVMQVWNSMRKDSGDIETIRHHMPAAADEIAAAHLRNKPQDWNKLPLESQRALVPNPFDRLTLGLHAAPKPDLVTETARNKEPFLGAGAGYALGELLKPHGAAEGSTSLMSPTAWGAVGTMTPTILHFLAKAKENPRMFKVPAMGAVTGLAGANAGEGASPAGSPLLR